ncbi:extracellular solute-binding protein [Acidiferrimicrobium sp. IK]|uniref:extracellular solute-binding protein n=1 Tax=Acidiferrimicrobium sp. IK TaxID=2871700 RepID=UPI0021CAFA3F|nr:extracellular solute-binding protein [Acidiferrimicrobium sp. IK]MCU4184467.1 extracellular solute-binding protein [Acidiferrimicrobium sp. IK]
MRRLRPSASDPGAHRRGPSRHQRAVVGLALAGLAAAASGCGSSTSTTAATAAPAASAPGAAGSTAGGGSGPVDVLYAGSLVSAMTKQIGPAFDAATGYTFTGFSGDSSSLAASIRGKIRQGDVFISASPTVNTTLEGAANGDWVSWYASFASTPLVLGYNPKSKFASDVKSKPWYQVLTEPGILVGRTDPSTDPKGKLTATALETAAVGHAAPGLKSIAASTSDVYPEDTLVGRLQSGQLDVGFFYAAEAKAAGIPTVPLTGETLSAAYTITVLNHAADEKAAEAFVAYLLGAGGASMLNSDGFTLRAPPPVSGTGVPAGLRGVLSQR